MELSFYVRAVRQNLIAFLAIVLLGVAVGTAGVLLRPLSYTSNARLYITVTGASDVSDLNQTVAVSSSIAPSFAIAAGSSTILDEVGTQTGLSKRFPDLSSHVSAQVEPGTSVISISATMPTAAESATVANAVVTVLQQRTSSLAPTSTGRVALRSIPLQFAQAPGSSSSTAWYVIEVISLAIGLLLGTAVCSAVALVRSGRDTMTFRATDDEEMIVA